MSLDKNFIKATFWPIAVVFSAILLSLPLATFEGLEQFREAVPYF